jgi:hypothetical protein
MTLLVAYVGTKDSYLAADTAGTNMAAGGSHEIAKLIPLSLASSVIAVRGPTALLTELFHNNQLSGGSFEKVRSNTDRGLKEWLEDALKAIEKEGYSVASYSDAEVVLVGWCRESKKMRGVIWFGSLSAGFESEEFNGWFTTPRVTHTEQRGTSKVEQIRGIAGRQASHMRQLDASVFVGGRLLISRIEMDAIHLQTLRMIAKV